MLVLLALVFSTLLAQGVTYKKLYEFHGGSDGVAPFAGLVRDSKGNLYGTTFDGGAASSASGTVFKVDRTGKETVLHSFRSSRGDGAFPTADLIRDAEGNLYGTTDEGGDFSLYGTVFKLNAAGKESLLYSFSGGTDGAFPEAGLIQDASGNLYGVTFDGGAAGCSIGAGLCGVVFKLDKNGKETVLYSFTGPDGARPAARLMMDTAGSLYGTTTRGGPVDGGTVFKLDTSGVETVLHSFSGSDGASPEAGVIMDADGNLYGTTTFGGHRGVGVVFKLDPSGKETVLHSFTGGADGQFPEAGVIMDKAGNLYGTAFAGGPAHHGVIYKLDRTGKETTLYTFPTKAGGARSRGGLIMDAKGNLYGTTKNGGDPACRCGVVFRLAP
jgi:uncharacterized repeat protein (TIGR03803 family)